MRILIAPDSFKESLSAIEVANAIEAGFKQILPHADYYKISVADGGEGTMQSLIDAKNGERIACKVHDPLGRIITAYYGFIASEKLAIIEMAESSGLIRLLPEERNPLVTSSFGTGELLLDALNRGAEKMILAIGGSATNDGGAGMLSALGAHFLDRQGDALSAGGLALQFLKHIDLSRLDDRLANISLEVACDVDNPLLGARGASHIFAPQKGATPEEVLLLDAALTNYADIVAETLGQDHRAVAGSGAAGGMGFAAISFLNGILKPGIDIVLEAVQFEAALQQVDLVITGEGRIDAQTAFGKTPIGVATLAKKYDKSVIAIAGSLGDGYEAVYDYGIDAVFSIMQKPDTLENALNNAVQNLQSTSQNIARIYQLATVD